MEMLYSKHWRIQKQFRSDITDGAIIYAVANSDELRDKRWSDALNAITRVPPSGRIIKVVYKRLSKDKLKIITAMWLD